MGRNVLVYRAQVAEEVGELPPSTWKQLGETYWFYTESAVASMVPEHGRGETCSPWIPFNRKRLTTKGGGKGSAHLPG